jgi:hypothetical protein
MRFVEHETAHDSIYLQFANQVGGASLAKPFSYYGKSDAIEVRRHLLVDDAVDPPIVIGAISVKVQDYVLAGRTLRVAVATYPVGLGVAQSKYALSGTLIFRKLLNAYPLNILGTGGPETSTVAKLCLTLGWQLNPVPYLFLPLRLGPLVAKQLATRPHFAAVARMANMIGLFTPFDLVLRGRVRRASTGDLHITRVPGFDAELDEWWSTYSKEVGFGLVRDSRQLNAMFPTTIDAFERLVFRRSGRIVGFAVLLIPKSEDAMRTLGANVMTLVEFCALGSCLGNSAAVLAEYIRQKRLDSVIVNHSQSKTVDALKAVGFLVRSTNMYLAVSPQLQSCLNDAGVSLSGMLITRADGDGPIGLGVNF